MPRNVLHIPQKRSTLPSSALSNVLREQIAGQFTDSHPDAFVEDLREIASLRDRCVRMEPHTSSIVDAQRYNAQLAFLVTKFPAEIGLAFSWTIAFPATVSLFSLGALADDSPPSSPGGAAPAPSKPYLKTSGSSQIVGQPNIHYERAALLFSVAAIYSAMGANETRAEGESIKRAIAAFQASAGTLHYILVHIAPLLTPLFTGKNARFADVDLLPARLACLRDAMLAQAQECFWQKAVADRLKDATIAKLATRTSELYASAVEFAETGGSIEPAETGAPRGCEMPKEWLNHMGIKRWHFAAAAQFRKSTDDLSANRYGDELGRLRLAEQYTKKAGEISKSGVSDAIISDLKSLQGVIQTNLARASKDNDLIYLEAVTPADKLSTIASAAMVEAKVPGELASPIQYLRDSPAPAFGKPLFRELVPYGVHVAISVFDERKDSFVREEIEVKKQELDALAASTLQSLDLPGSLQALEQPIGLPPALTRKSEEVASQGGSDRLKALSRDVGNVARQASDIWREIAGALQQQSLQSQQGMPHQHQAWQRIAEQDDRQTRLFEEEAHQYGETLEQARDSDGIVQSKLQEWLGVIDVLSSGKAALDNFVPGQKRSVALSGEQGASVRALRVEMEALDDLMAERSRLCDEAKALARRHDVRGSVMREAGILGSGADRPLVIEPAHFEPLFERELQIYEPLRKRMLDSEERQTQQLDVIAEKNAAFVLSRKVDASMQKRQEALQTLDVGYTKYRELSDNLVEGLKFYNAMLKMLYELRDNVQQWRYQRQGEIDELTAQLEQASVEVTLQSTGSAGGRQTRSKSKKGKDATRKEEGGGGGSPPSWGAWQGGQIQFAD